MAGDIHNDGAQADSDDLLNKGNDNNQAWPFDFIKASKHEYHTAFILPKHPKGVDNERCDKNDECNSKVAHKLFFLFDIEKQSRNFFDTYMVAHLKRRGAIDTPDLAMQAHEYTCVARIDDFGSLA